MTRPVQPFMHHAASQHPAAPHAAAEDHKPFEHKPFPRVPDHYLPDEYDPVTDAAGYNPVFHDPDFFNDDEDRAAPAAPQTGDAAIQPFDETPDALEDELSDLLDFAPVPGSRPDGWTKRRQQIFIRNLATGAGVSHAARTAGMSPRSAYLLRARKDAHGFIAAWDQAVQLGVAILEDAAFDLALNGAPFHKTNAQGQIVHTEYRINASVLMQLLRAHKPLVYSYAAQRDAVNAAREEREQAARELAAYQEAVRAAPPDPQEQAVRLCLAEDEISKAAAEAGVEPDLSDDNVARVAARLPRIAPSQVTVVGMRLLEKRRRDKGLPVSSDEMPEAGTPEADVPEADVPEADVPDTDQDSAEETSPPLNRTQRRARDRRLKKSANRKKKISYSALQKRQKTGTFPCELV